MHDFGEMMMKWKWLSRVLFVVGLVLLCVVAWLHSHKLIAGRSGLGQSFALDMEQYMTVDPALRLYDELAPLSVDLATPVDLAVGPQDRLYVGGGQTVVVLEAQGEEIQRLDLEGAVRSLAVSAEGTLYVGVGNHIEVYGPEGEQRAVWPPFARETLPSSIVLRGDEVLVGDARYGQILRHNLAGELTDRIEGLVLFSSPVLGLAVDGDGQLWAANPGRRELHRYSAAGELEFAWAKPGRQIDSFSGCCNPIDIAFRPDGLMVTAEKSLLRVKVLDATGKLIGVVAAPSDFDEGSTHLALAVDSAGRVLVLDPQRHTVRVFVEKVGE
jgi:hypothetical protein